MLKRFSILRWLTYALLATLAISAAVAQETCDVPLLVSACSESATGTACMADGTSVPLEEALNATEPQVLRLSDTLTVILIGAQLTTFEQGEIASAGVEIGNAAGYNVNLRSGPGSNFDQVGFFRFDDRLTADGQSADGAWLRVQLEDGTVAWVAKSLVVVDPALDTLPIVDQGATGGVIGYGLTLEPAETACAQTGALITTSGDAPQRLTVNGFELANTNGTLYLSVGPLGFTTYVLAGETAVGTGENRQALNPSDVVAWVNDGSDPASDIFAPFPSLALLDNLGIAPGVCLINGSVAAFAEPDINATVGANLNGGGSYPVIETSGDGWYHLTEAFGGGWVEADAVTTLGPCADLPDASAAPAVSVMGAGMTPDQVMYEYLLARLVADGARMQALACASWDSQALLQSQSFRAMRAELLNVACYTASQSGANATVQCDGQIQTEYNGEFRQWELGAYAMSQENGAWRVCGEAR